MELKDFLDIKAVRFVSSASSKKRLLQDVSEQAAAIYNLDESVVLNALLEREKLGSTGVGRGVAIPHARLPDLDRVFGLFIRLEKPVDFESVDRQPADLIFTILAPQAEGADHLKALALVSRTLRSENVCETLRANDDGKTLYSILTEVSQNKAA